MKKLIAMAIAAVCLVSASFALDLEFGGRVVLGRNLGNGNFSQEVADAKSEGVFDYGAGAYANFALFGGLGVQAEANYIKSSINFNEKDSNGNYVPRSYDLHTLDLAPMVWLNLDLWKFTLGFGAGPNFSILIPDLKGLQGRSKEDFKLGLIAGADFKFYFTQHLGLVLSGRYITEWEEKKVTVEAYGQSIETPLPDYSFNRKTFYGGLGLEFKLI